jgi:broad specificity phosphatase PhoE
MALFCYSKAASCMNPDGKDKLRIAFIRHGPTQWNDEGRLQGRKDIPLSETGRLKMSTLRPPAGFESARAYVSPLSRARETSQLLGLADATVDERLSEHGWGSWEGLTREEILARDGQDAFERAGRGINFTPKDGESTRELVARVAAFLIDVAKEDDDAIAITHRGILRTAYTLATGWDMASPMPEKLDLTCALILTLKPGGQAEISELNVPLRSRRASGV